MDFAGLEYNVYCLLNFDLAWTLLLSYSVANGSSSSNFLSTLNESHPVGENALNWKGYRLRKSRMESIKENYTLLQFTCDHEKHFDSIRQSDHIQIPLENVKSLQDGQTVVVNVLELHDHTPYFDIGKVSGKIAGTDLSQCKISLGHLMNILHVHIDNNCQVNGPTCAADRCQYFRSRRSVCPDCTEHHCVQNDQSTTQLWFGTRKDNTNENP